MTAEAIRFTPRLADDAPRGAASLSPRLWGLSATQLHDAYWRSHGIECVRRADGVAPLSGADAYMLLEPDQLVVFDLREITDALQWTRATLCRLRVVEAGEDAYRERVRIGDDGLVKRIDRVYTREYRAGYRVLFTDRHGLAKAWHAAGSRRDAWLALRRSVPWFRTDDFRVHGHSYRRGETEDEGRLVSRLVDQWSDPERAIEGIEPIADGIIGLKGSTMVDGETLVGPLWLGASSAVNPRTSRLRVGPAWVPDESSVSTVRVLDVAEILSPERRTARQRGRTSDSSMYPLVKRAIDVVVSFVVLLCLLPVLIPVACAVVVDDGLPIFFGHRRQTMGGRIFRCWKFRTMRRNAETLAKELRSLNVCDGPQFFIKDDPRVTRVGQVLRKWHLDELPQFWNVLVGDMSLVGPRPSPDGENQFCPAWRELRLGVRPGITGLWQVERTREPGRDFQEWIRYDIEYVNRASLSLDIEICFKTIANIIAGGGHGSAGASAGLEGKAPDTSRRDHGVHKKS
ncbi:MAG: sugar transferase [Phycisphaerae bacterium]|nr:sugar transferase [Phycisphaerae bacterium]